jgi:serine/alanine adding enzyme
METVILKEKDKQDWERFVAENSSTIAWQSYDWSQVLKRHYKFDFFPVAVYDGSNICGIFPLYHMKTRFSRNSLISVPYAVAGGMVSDDSSVRKLLLDKAIELSKKYHSCTIVLKQYKYKIEGDLAVDDNYYNKELDLSKNIEQVWAGLAEKNKQRIGQTDKRDFVLDYPSGDITTFYNLLLKSHHRKGVPCVSKRWIQDLLAFKLYSIALLKVGNKAVAGTLVKEFKATVSFPFTCVEGDNNETWPYRLYWELIKHFSLQGKEIFHSGRIPKDDSTDQYRLGWGGTKYNYFYQYYPHGTMTTEFSRKKGRKRELIERLWKMMPQYLARLIGPYVVKQFP